MNKLQTIINRLKRAMQNGNDEAFYRALEEYNVVFSTSLVSIRKASDLLKVTPANVTTYAAECESKIGKPIRWYKVGGDGKNSTAKPYIHPEDIEPLQEFCGTLERAKAAKANRAAIIREKGGLFLEGIASKWGITKQGAGERIKKYNKRNPEKPIKGEPQPIQGNPVLYSSEQFQVLDKWVKEGMK